jgi:hypothetical protein
METNGYYAGIMINDMFLSRFRAGNQRQIKLLKYQIKS